MVILLLVFIKLIKTKKLDIKIMNTNDKMHFFI